MRNLSDIAIIGFIECWRAYCNVSLVGGTTGR